MSLYAQSFPIQPAGAGEPNMGPTDAGSVETVTFAPAAASQTYLVGRAVKTIVAQASGYDFTIKLPPVASCVNGPRKIDLLLTDATHVLTISCSGESKIKAAVAKAAAATPAAIADSFYVANNAATFHFGTVSGAGISKAELYCDGAHWFITGTQATIVAY